MENQTKEALEATRSPQAAVRSNRWQATAKAGAESPGILRIT